MSLSTIRKLLSLNLGKAPARRPAPRRQSPLRFEHLEDRLTPTTINVGPNDSIQAAINLAKAGDTIKISGTHTEQVVIANDSTHVLDGLRLVGANGRAVIQAPATMSSTGAIVEVNGAKNVLISSLTIQSNVGGSADGFYGILVDGSGSAKISGNHITRIRDVPISGMQRGVGIRVGGDTPGSATIVDNVIDKYQKNGIDVKGVGSSATIDGNRIVGAGPTAVIGQNGIVIEGGATADVSDNVVTGNVYTGTGYAATGILVNGAGMVTIEDNTASYNQIGIYVNAAKSTVVDSNCVNDNTYVGIYVSGSTAVTLTNNVVLHNGSADAGAGIALYNSQNVVVVRNVSSNNIGDGIFVDSDATGNTFLSNVLTGNTAYDAEDASIGTGTAGTANTWTKNQGKTSSPTGLVSMTGQYRRFQFGCGR